MSRSKLLEEVVEDEIVDSNFLYKKKVGEFYFSCVTTSRGFASSDHYYSLIIIYQRKHKRVKALVVIVLVTFVHR